MNEEIKPYIGIVEDPRTKEEKDQDFIHEELYMAPPEAKWEEREPKKYPIRNQDGSSACVSFAVAKILAIDEVYEGRPYVELSPRSIYVRRSNKDTGGMWLPEALDIARKHGATLESLVPSDDKGETAMNSWDGMTPETDAIGLKYKTAGRVDLPIDIEAIASITSMGKGVLLGHRFDYDEWTNKPTVNPNSKMSCGHGVAGVDNILKNGEKLIIIDDSWGPLKAKFGQREITQDWLKKRCFYAGYTRNFIYDSTKESKKPIHTFTKYMKRGDKNNDISKLQDILKYEGLFPMDTDSTGLYGPATQRGVRLFQLKYKIKTNNGVQVGPLTIAKLNELYSK